VGTGVWGERSVARCLIESVSAPASEFQRRRRQRRTDGRHFMNAVIDTFDVSNQITI